MSVSSRKRSSKRRRFLKFLGMFGLSIAALAGAVEVLFWHRDGVTVYGTKAIPLDEDEVGVMAYNIANARGSTRGFLDSVPADEQVKNLEKIINTIMLSNASIVALNEVDFGSSRTGNVNQARFIAQHLSRHWGVAYLAEGINMDYVPIPFKGTVSMGNAVVSRYPVKISKHHVFGCGLLRPFEEFKGYLDVSVDINGRNVDVVATHLHASSRVSRVSQASDLALHLGRKEDSFILLGDLNARPDDPYDPTIRILKGVAVPAELSLSTTNVPNGEVKIDYVMSSADLPVSGCSTYVDGASDHKALSCYAQVKKVVYEGVKNGK